MTNKSKSGESSISESNAVVLARLEGKIDGLNERVSDLIIKLYGNGKPGIIVEQVLQSEEIEKLLGYAETNKANIETLKKLTVPAWLSTHWFRVLVVLVIIMLLVHSIIPKDTSIWELIKTLK